MIDVLLQLHVAREETKFGFSVDELMDFFENWGFESFFLFFYNLSNGDLYRLSFIDSMALKVFHIKREYQNKVFQGISAKSKGAFFKLHIIINDKGKIISFVIT